MAETEAATPARTGPRPLALHLALAMSSGAGAVAALPGALAGVLPWHDDLAAPARDLCEELAKRDAAAVFAAVAGAQAARLQQMMAGIRAYHAHPHIRDLPPAAAIWQEGSTRILDYGGDGDVAALFVPSLINRYYVLDLAPERSLLRWLGKQGVRTLVVDWDTPDEAALGFALDDYITGRLSRGLDAALSIAGKPTAVVGYCLGGNLALALACHRQADLVGLGLLATPWDFHAGRGAETQLFQLMEGSLDHLLRAFGELPVDVLQALFAWLDPNLALRKFRRFAGLDPKSSAAEAFVALEDWLNDGVPLAPKVARTCLVDWYGRNTPPRGDWSIGGRTIRPEIVPLPAFVAIPDNDRIVPPASTEALAVALPRATTIRPRAGHIGMVVGAGGRRGLWCPLRDWLIALAK